MTYFRCRVYVIVRSCRARIKLSSVLVSINWKMKELLIFFCTFFCTMMLEANTDNINERDTKTRGSPSNWINCQGMQSFPMNICNITVGERAVGYNSEDKPKSYQIPESQRDAILKVHSVLPSKSLY
jgi:hypothetical protein